MQILIAMTPYPLQPTAGNIPADKIAGRENEIKNLFTLLQSQSVLIEEFRRMGKTLLLQKLEFKSKQDGLVNKAFYFNVQGIQDKTEITDELLYVLRNERNLSFLKTNWGRCKKMYNAVKPEIVNIADISFKLPEFKTKWKEAITACLEDIAERNSERGELVTLILDEFPMMLWNWVDNDKAADAMELLDLLRNIRQSLKENGNIRFVICGSIGMKVVLDRLREEFRYTGEPFNDTITFSLEPMAKEDAEFLCECLFLSGFTCNGDKAFFFARICQLTERLPFYINKIFLIVHLSYGSELSSDNIDKAFSDILTHPNHADVFEQLHSRLTTYHGSKARNMQDILNFLSEKEWPASEIEIVDNINQEKETVLQGLERLIKEHYLQRTFINQKRHYTFKYQLFRKWWQLNKA